MAVRGAYQVADETTTTVIPESVAARMPKVQYTYFKRNKVLLPPWLCRNLWLSHFMIIILFFVAILTVAMGIVLEKANDKSESVCSPLPL